MRMSHIGICVSDWKRSLRFYHDVLGFRYVHELEVKGEPADTLLRLKDVALRAIYLEREGVRIELLHYASPGCTGDGEPRPLNRLGLTHLSLRVDDLDALLPELAAGGARVLRETRIEIPAARTKAAFVTDPDGTLIELVQQPGD
jgi:catechol 2,3-dioxygenase-like lactoylglutathione lyase family enzyme